MALYSSDHKLRLFTLTVLEKLTMTSALNCEKFVKAKGPEYVVLLMADANKQLLHMLIDLVWNSLENGPKDQVVLQLKGKTDVFIFFLLFWRNDIVNINVRRVPEAFTIAPVGI